ncbi:MAG: hypothetical protein GKR91_04640 [Pseudomonadales bacterium]|nr:hypothetical protein [Pseudomonadales bacterium]
MLNDKEIDRKLNGNTQSPQTKGGKRGTMKEQKWDDSLESTKEFLDPGAVLPDDTQEEEEIRVAAPKTKSHLTELRRRIEERLDSKRIDLEYDWEEQDEISEKLQ